MTHGIIQKYFTAYYNLDNKKFHYIFYILIGLLVTVTYLSVDSKSLPSGVSLPLLFYQSFF